MKWKAHLNQLSPMYPNGFHTIKVDDDAELPIATVFNGLGAQESATKKRIAHAKLIAKAPEMKEGILETLEFLQGIPVTKEVFELIKKLGLIISETE